MNIKKISLGVAVSVALVTSSVAMANTKATTGIVVGGQLGYSFLDSYPDKFFAGTKSLKKEHFAWGLYAGYDYAFSDVMKAGLELGYDSDGVAKYGSDGKINISEISLMLTGAYVDPTGFNVFGKLGATRVTEDFKDSSIVTSDLDEIAPKIVVGVGYEVMDNLNVYVSYGHIFAKGKSYLQGTPPSDKKLDKPQSNDRIMAGVSYTIPME